MNEKIKQLAEQANIHFSRVGILDGDPNGMAKLVSYSKMEKFADLIVQECTNAVRDGTWEGDNFAARVEGVFGINHPTITFRDEE